MKKNKLKHTDEDLIKRVRLREAINEIMLKENNIEKAIKKISKLK